MLLHHIKVGDPCMNSIVRHMRLFRIRLQIQRNLQKCDLTSAIIGHADLIKVSNSISNQRPWLYLAWEGRGKTKIC